MNGKYTVEPGADRNSEFVWFYRDEHDSAPVALVSREELSRGPGGAQLWESIANMVETGEVLP